MISKPSPPLQGEGWGGDGGTPIAIFPIAVSGKGIRKDTRKGYPYRQPRRSHAPAWERDSPDASASITVAIPMPRRVPSHVANLSPSALRPAFLKAAAAKPSP